MRELIVLNRDCEGTIIPEGRKVTLMAGSQVEMTQELGGCFTVMTSSGYMVRVEGKDAPALGKEIKAVPDAQTLAQAPLEKLVWEQLKTCYDPEIPVDIANLGLVYTCEITDCPEGGKKVFVEMTLTAPGCGMGETIRMDVKNKVEKLPNVREVLVNLVWEPQWNQSMMSDAAKLKLGLL